MLFMNSADLGAELGTGNRRLMFSVMLMAVAGANSLDYQYPAGAVSRVPLAVTPFCTIYVLQMPPVASFCRCLASASFVTVTQSELAAG